MIFNSSGCDESGRRAGLKILWQEKCRRGSIPLIPTSGGNAQIGQALDCKSDNPHGSGVRIPLPPQ